MKKSSSSVNNRNISKLESIVKETMVVEDMLLYKCNGDDETFNIINGENRQPLELEESFLKYAIDSKKAEFDNHITSNKHYKSKLDNPKDLTIRGMLMFPIIDNKKTIGVLSLYRSVKQGINFTKKDKTTVNGLKSLLLKAIKDELIEDNDSVEIEIEAVIKEYILKELESTRVKKELSQKNQELEDELTKIKETKKIEKQKVEKLKESLVELEDTNGILIENIKEKNTLITRYYNNEIKAKYSQKKLSNNFEYIEKNIEFLLKEFGDKFRDNHNTYILFETMLYAITSSKSMNIIDNFLSKTKGFNSFITDFYSSTNIKANRDKYKIKNIFENMDSINLDKNIPSSLVVDTPKINSILFHIIADLTIFQEDKKLINVDMSYDNQLLHIKIDGRVYKNSSLFSSLFKQKISDNDKDRKGLIISNRLIKMMKGKIDISYDEKEYQYNISIPAKVLDLKFV
ncbi:MAG: GAF domain-containing protein [Sulfurovum sp.]